MNGLNAASSNLESLSAAATSLNHSLRHLAGFHGDSTAGRPSVDGDPRAGRAASFRIAWELHRAAEMVDQARAGVDRAYEIQGTIAYDVRETTALAADHQPPPRPGRSL